MIESLKVKEITEKMVTKILNEKNGKQYYTSKFRLNNNKIKNNSNGQESIKVQ